MRISDWSSDVCSSDLVDRLSIAAMAIRAVLCLLSGIVPAVVIDAVAPTVQFATGTSMPVQTDIAWLSIVPIAESRSSYNGWSVLVFIEASANAAAFVIHRETSDKMRRAPAWECGFHATGRVSQKSAGQMGQEN